MFFCPRQNDREVHKRIGDEREKEGVRETPIGHRCNTRRNTSPGVPFLVHGDRCRVFLGLGPSSVPTLESSSTGVWSGHY